jgi:phosphatidylglycerophosphate synthase
MTLAVELVGANDALLWGLTSAERACRIAAAQGLRLADAGAADILVNLDYVFDTSWLRWIAAHPGHALMRDGLVALAHVGDAATAALVQAAMRERRPLPPASGLTVVDQEDCGAFHDLHLRKREQPFLERLTARDRARLERISYYASYKGVTDLLTKYLWPEWALALTRAAARLGLTPNFVTAVGALFCVLAGIFFYRGQYWPGLAFGLFFMVLDTVDGKLARCTITSSRIGDVLDHGIDLVHPLIWWWAWGIGLAAYGRPLESGLFLAVMVALVAGYVVQRLIEGAFILGFGIHIHVWERLDSRFRLITARRNPNMVILFVALLVGYPDIGLVAVAAWTSLSCLFHLVRLGQALAARARAVPVVSWLQ